MATTLGTRIHQARKRAGLTITELSEKVGVHFSTISRYEHDLIAINVPTLKKIAKALKVEIGDLLQ